MAKNPESGMKQCTFPGCEYKHKYACYLKSHEQIHISDPKVRLPYECSLCEYRARIAPQLKAHIQRCHTDQYPHQCSVPGCDYRAKMMTDVHAHVRRKHTSVQMSCTFEGCSHKSKTKANLRVHILNRHVKNREKTVECPLCLRKFFKPGQMQSHLRSHTKEKPWQCSLCSYETKAEAHLRRHVEAVHPNIVQSSSEQVLKCDSCDFTTTFSERMKHHAFSHLDFKKWPYVCRFPGCNYRAKWKHTLEAHEVGIHAPERLPCPEPGCSYVAKHGILMKMHVKGVHKKPFSCSFPACKRQFHSEIACRNHQRLHDPNRPIQCEKCPQRYKDKKDLKLHNLQAHAEGKNFQCQHCSYGTNERGHLRGHLKRIHQAEDIVCPEPGCNYQSCSPTDMAIHSRRHDKKTHPFKCEQCTVYRFTHRSSLNKHKREVHKKPSQKLPAPVLRASQGRERDENSHQFTCRLCSCTFMDAVTLTRHSFSHKMAIVRLTKLQVEFVL